MNAIAQNATTTINPQTNVVTLSTQRGAEIFRTEHMDFGISVLKATRINIEVFFWSQFCSVNLLARDSTLLDPDPNWIPIPYCNILTTIESESKTHKTFAIICWNEYYFLNKSQS